MNSKDIAHARRLIDQFEGRALGRHNSAVDLRLNEVAEAERPRPGARTATVGHTGEAELLERIPPAPDQSIYEERFIVVGPSRRLIADYKNCQVGDICRDLPGGADPRTDLFWNIPLRTDAPYLLALLQGSAEDISVEMRVWRFEAVRGRDTGNGGIIYAWRRIE